jgi:hypothetical protein
VKRCRVDEFASDGSHLSTSWGPTLQEAMLQSFMGNRDLSPSPFWLRVAGRISDRAWVEVDPGDRGPGGFGFLPAVEMASLRFPRPPTDRPPVLRLPMDERTASSGVRPIDVEPELSPGEMVRVVPDGTARRTAIVLVDYLLPALFLEDALDALERHGYRSPVRSGQSSSPPSWASAGSSGSAISSSIPE